MSTHHARERTVVGTVQINNSFSGQDYLPYSVAVLEAYARRHLADPARVEFRQPVYRRTAIGAAVDRLHGCDLVGFSAYVWNFRISLEIARRLKSLDPRVVIVFGGPHVPDDATAFMAEHTFVDVAVHGEGEQTFTALIDAMPGQDWRGVDGITYRGPDGAPIRTPRRERLRNLADLPSPFLDGTFVPLMRDNPETMWIGLWETNRGCPFKCTFCDWGSATGDKVAIFEEERLLLEVDWFSQNKVEFIFCCDANFGIKKRDVDLATYVAEVKRRTGYPVALSVQNTKNATERAYQTQKILSDAGLNKGVALSMQSLDPTTLKFIRRDNISLDTYFELQKRFTRDKVETYSDIILGMPGETYDTLAEGIEALIASGQHNRIQFNNLSILPNAEMGDPGYQARHGMVTVESEIINIHGERVRLEDDVPEFQQLVVATASMPHEDWRQARAFCWMVALLHFDKLFQIPLIMANVIGGLRYRDAIEGFLNAPADRYPTIAAIRDLFIDQARIIQDGGPEYLYAPEWLGIHWPQDEYVFIKLAAERSFEAFYAEAGDVLRRQMLDRGITLPEGLLDDALALNRTMMKLPGQWDDVTVEVGYNVMDVYQAVRTGAAVPLAPRPTAVAIKRSSRSYDNFQDWCREVVWWGNKKGAYLYTSTSHEKQLAGHY
jgi:radical SAM superfamily enzyme YgiQ (UPF0313 family)